MENPDDGTERNHMENPDDWTERHHIENPNDGRDAFRNERTSRSFRKEKWPCRHGTSRPLRNEKCPEI